MQLNPVHFSGEDQLARQRDGRPDQWRGVDGGSGGQFQSWDVSRSWPLDKAVHVLGFFTRKLRSIC
jgi:hypothetical protein